jgi:hypothetical protein
MLAPRTKQGLHERFLETARTKNTKQSNTMLRHQRICLVSGEFNDGSVRLKFPLKYPGIYFAYNFATLIILYINANVCVCVCVCVCL